MIEKYRSFKHYNAFNYLNELNRYLAGKDLHQIFHENFVNLLIYLLDKHAPMQGNEQPFMTKELRKEYMKRTRLLNKYRRNRTAENEASY